MGEEVVQVVVVLEHQPMLMVLLVDQVEVEVVDFVEQQVILLQ